MLQRSALDAGEYGTVEQLRHHLHLALRCLFTPWVLEVLAHEDDTSAGTTKGLVCGAGDDVSVFNRIVEQTSGNESGWMCHVYHEYGSHTVCYLSHALVIPLTAVC